MKDPQINNNNSENDNSEYLSEFHKRISSLLNATLPREKGKPSEFTTLTFTPSAQKEWEATSRVIEQQCRAGGIYENASDHASKLIDNIGRIAALLHLCEREDDTTHISRETFEWAREFGMRYSLHFLTYFSVPTQVQVNAEKIYEKLFVRLGNTQQAFSLSYVGQYTHLPVKEIKQAIPLLEKEGYVSRYGPDRYQFFPEPESPNDARWQHDTAHPQRNQQAPETRLVRHTGTTPAHTIGTFATRSGPSRKERKPPCPLIPNQNMLH